MKRRTHALEKSSLFLYNVDVCICSRSIWNYLQERGECVSFYEKQQQQQWLLADYEMDEV